MVQPKHEQRIAVIENAFINGLLVSSLIDPLKDCDRMPGGLAGDLLKADAGLDAGSLLFAVIANRFRQLFGRLLGRRE